MKTQFNLKSELTENNVIMIVVPNGIYTKKNLEVVKQLNALGNGIAYVTLNQMCDTLINYFK